MPEIRDYTAPLREPGQIDVQPLAEAAYHIERQAKNVAESIRQGTEGLNQGLKDIAERQQQAETLDTAKKMSDWHLTAVQSLEQARQSADPHDATWLSKWYETNVTQPLDKMSEGIESPKAQDYFQTHRDSIENELFTKGASYQSEMLGNAHVADANGLIDNAVNRLSIDPSSLHAELQRLPSTMQAIPAQARETMQQEATNHMVLAAGNGVIARIATPEGAEAAKKVLFDPDGDYMKGAPRGAVDEWQQKIIEKTNTLVATQFDILKTQVPDLVKLARQGDPDAANRLTLLAQQGSASPDKAMKVAGAEISRDLNDAQQFFKATRAINDMPEPAMRAAVDSLPPEEARTPAQAAVAAAAKQRDADFHKDPATYMTTNDSVVQSRFQAYAQQPTPQNFQAYAQTTIAAQGRLYPHDTPKILPPQFVDDVAAKMKAIPDTPDGWQQAATTLQQLQQTTGSYWNYAVHELQNAHVLKPGQYVAGMLMGQPQSYALAGDVLKATSMSGEDLYKSSGVTEASAYTTARAAFKDFNATFSDTTNGHELTESYVTALADVLRYKGKDAMNAGTAQRLANAMILDRYNVRGGLRIPKDFDDMDVAQGANSVLGDIKNHDLVPPPSFSNFGPALQGDAYKADVQDFGHWSTNAKGDGAMLFDQYGSPVYEKKGGQTVPVELQYSDLQKLGRQNRGVVQDVTRFFTKPETLGGQ